MNTVPDGTIAFALGLAMVTAPFLTLGGMLWLAGHRQRVRECAVARQIALTDAVHRQFGALVAPTVRKPLFGPWQVLIPVPLQRPDLVGRVLAVISAAMAATDRRMAKDVRIVLTPREETRR